MTQTSLTFGISGLNCGGCVGRAEAALAALPGATDAHVSLATKSGRVSGVSAGAVLEGLRDAGYAAQVNHHSFHVPNMSCASCVARIETAAQSVPGTVSVRANLASHTIRVETLADAEALRGAFAQAGYPVASQDKHEVSTALDEVTPLFHRFLLAAALTMPVFLTEMGGHIYPPLHHWLMATIGTSALQMGQLLLTALVLLGPGRGFFIRGIPGLFRARPDMDALVALGAGAAFLFSAVSVLIPAVLPPSGVYFEAAAVIVTLILMGRWLEARAKGRTTYAVQALLGLRPDTALLLRDGKEEEVPLDTVMPGDILRVRPGDRVPVDGNVTDGSAHVDEAMLTGEPMPVLKSPGGAVIAGTILTNGTLLFETTHVGRDTVLARIAQLTEQAQNARLPVEALINRITAVFVPVVMGLAALTFGLWWALAGLGPAVVAGVSVLIIACPCAMGLATPMSIMVGMGRAARSGILFQKGSALQQLQNARLIAFDKTGTLTLGRPVLDTVATNMDRDRLLALVAGVEAGSEHPLALALKEAAPEIPTDVSDFSATAGEGAEATVEGQRVSVGNLAYLDRLGIPASANLTTQADNWAATGATPVHVAVDGTHVASLSVSDALRPDAADAIASLKAGGRRVAMISGDVEAAARHVAGLLGVDEVIAGVRPDGKVTAIEHLRASHGPVAFVGDGINDAPALAAADVGLAVGGASDVAVEAADVVLMRAGPQAVAQAIDISAATLRNIRQNLAWAFGYNVLLIPVAAGVLAPFGGPQLSPQLAALAMALSSVFVVTNALRLRGKGTS